MIRSTFLCGRYRFRFHETSRPLVMGILNITPDSFSDGGYYLSLEQAVDQAEKLIAEQVDIIDIGGESTRPGGQPISLQEELDRVMPVVYALRDCGRPLSVDTSKPEVMRQVLLAGADMINDINGFRGQEAIAAVTNIADNQFGLCTMHMQGRQQTMQQAPAYGDQNLLTTAEKDQAVVDEVDHFLMQSMSHLVAAGVAKERIVLDPGFGFGKKLQHNLALFRDLPLLAQRNDRPVLIGISRKSMLGELTGRPIEQRAAATVASTVMAADAGVAIIRVHDVAAAVDALNVWHAIRHAHLL